MSTFLCFGGGGICAMPAYGIFTKCIRLRVGGEGNIPIFEEFLSGYGFPKNTA